MTAQGLEEPAQPRPPKQRLLLWVVVMVAVAAALTVGVNVLLYYLLLHPGGPVISGDVRQLTEIGKISLATVAGLGGVVALVVSFKKQRLTESDHALTIENAERDRVRVLNERFANAVSQLGDKGSAAVRIGGLYSLVKLADDWPNDRQRCIDVMCAYLRFPLKSGGDPEEVEVRRTIASTIREHLLESAEINWGDKIFDLRGALLDGLSLAGISLIGGTVNLSGCLISSGVFDLSVARLESGVVDAAGLVMTGGSANLRGIRVRGAELSFDNAQFEGGRLTLTETLAYQGKIRFNGACILGGEIDFSEMHVWCPPENYGYRVRLELNDLRVTAGLLNFENIQAVSETTGQYEVDPKTDPNRYLLMKMEDAKLLGGKISFRDVELKFGTISLRRLEVSEAAIVDFNCIKIWPGSRIGLRGAKINGGSLDFSNAWIGSPHTEGSTEAPTDALNWVRKLQEIDNAENRDVVYGHAHPRAHVDLASATIKGGLISFAATELEGALISLLGIKMSGGQITFAGCTYTNSVISLWKAHVHDEGKVDFATDCMGSPYIVHCELWRGVWLQNIRLHEYSQLIQVSARD